MHAYSMSKPYKPTFTRNYLGHNLQEPKTSATTRRLLESDDDDDELIVYVCV